jgi:transcriptional regulator with XRE-family HTH domain
MLVGNQLRVLREQRKMTQGDIEKRSGLMRCYVSRVENGHTVPSIETLERWARAFDVPLYHIFYDGKRNSPPLPAPKSREVLWGSDGKDAHVLQQFRRSLSHTGARDRKILLQMARKLARSRHSAQP